MVCRGIRYEGSVRKSCDNTNIYRTAIIRDMATMCITRWGRRKQANPKRTNAVDEAPLEADLQDPEQIPAADNTPHGSGNRSDGDDGVTSERPEPDPIIAERVDDQTEAVPTDSEMAPLSKEAAMANEIDGVVTPTSPAATNPEQASEDIRTNGYHGNEEAVSMEAEEVRIQELMSRSDTAVIFPEPVSDHEQTNITAENEGELDEDLAKCPHCDQAYPQLELLKEHWHSVHGGQTTKHNCPQCSISFQTKGHLDKHIALHSPSAQICRICRKTFANVYRLQRHMISHEESTELRKFKCPECQKAFKFKHHLKEHIRIHSGEKPFECQNCGKRFSHSGSYSSHMTSKKCWILNMKMRGAASASRVDRSADLASPTLAPKTVDGGGGGGDVSLASMMYGSGLLSQQFLPYDPATAAAAAAAAAAASQFHQTSFLNQMNGAQQNTFLSPMPALSTTISNAVLPSLTNVAAFGCLPPGCSNSQTSCVNGSQTDAAGVTRPKTGRASPVVRAEPTDDVTDENMNKTTDADGDVKREPNVERQADAVSELQQQQRRQQQQQQQRQRRRHQQQEQQEQTKEKPEVVGKPTDEKPEDGSHTLTALASAATEQLQQLMKESSTSEVKSEPTVDAEAHVDGTNGGGGQGSQTCRFCRETFCSPIGLHQHERYLCKQNDEIRAKAETPAPGTPNGSLCSPAMSNSHDESVVDECSESERKIRVRSMISDEQAQVLKSFYQNNQRPNKFELETLAQRIGFQKRVVQVWFQNMRARDRRKGRTTGRGGDGGSKPTGGGSCCDQNSPAAGYIPIVPQVGVPLGKYLASSTVVPRAAAVHAGPAPVYGTSASPQTASEATSFEAEQPLDLSVKVPQAHVGKPYSSLPEPLDADEVLNLSVKDRNSAVTESTEIKVKEEESGSSSSSSTSSSAAAADGAVAMVDGTTMTTSSDSVPLVVPIVTSSTRHSPTLVSVPIPINTTPAHSNNNNKSYVSITSIAHPVAFTQQLPAHAHHQQQQHHYQQHHHQQHHQQHHRDATKHGYEAALPLTSSPKLASAELLPTRPSSLENSFNSALSIDSNPDASPAAYVIGQKARRPRKKSWRQVGGAVESEEMQDLDESVDEDGDSPIRKKRRSWKQHRVDVADGLYACDQCDKMFSKQSSLARHKYEHSGQRPFPCDICTKAFKHKHHLTEHKRLHSGEKPFQCQKCGKRFSHSGSYSQHMNHRYKYCKPLLGDDCDNADGDMETEQSEASSP